MFQLVCKNLILLKIKFNRKYSFKSNQKSENVSIIFKIRKARKSKKAIMCYKNCNFN